MASYDTGYEDELFQHPVSHTLHCGICLNVLKDPVSCQHNEHLFCRACITVHLMNSQTCPSCMERLTVQLFSQAPRAVTNMISELKIRCQFFQRGCGQFIELENLERHVTDCGFAPAICSNEGCQLVVNKQDLTHHQTAVCEQRRVKCHSCDEIKQDMNTVKGGMDREPKVVIAGGWGKNSVEMLSLINKTWTLLQPMKECRASASSVIYNNHIFALGGFGESDATKSIEKLSLNTVHVDQTVPWEKVLADLPGKLWAHCSVVYNGRLIVIGGDDRSKGAFSDSITEISLAPFYTSERLVTMPQTRWCHGVALFGDKILILGGKVELRNETTLASVLLYDITMNECKELAPLPYPVSDMATGKWGDESVILAGGRDSNNNPLNKVLLYNIKTQQSRMLPDMKYKRGACMAAVVRNTVIVMGGRDKSGDDLKSVECFRFDRDTWEELPEMYEARCEATAVVC